MKHYLGICLVLVTLAAITMVVFYMGTRAVDHTIGSVRDAFNAVLKVQPQVTVNQRVVMTQTAPIAELAVVTKEELITIGMNEHYEVLSMEIPLTEKKLTAEAVYRIKAGFDLHEPFSVEIDPTTHDIKAKMPHAKILSVEQIGDITYHGEDAALNRVSDAERIDIVNNLNGAAKAAAESSALKSDAETQIITRLKELLTRDGQSLQVAWPENRVE
jgi:hypothetical protein